jgi:hypothetical protein
MREDALADIIVAACNDPLRMIEPGFCDPTDKRKLASHLNGMMRSARRYFLDEEVTEAASLLGVNHPELLVEMLRRARAPFAKLWLEWPSAAQMRAIGRERPDDAPERCGVYIERLDETRPLYRLTGVGAVTHPLPTGAVAESPISVIYNLDDPTGLPVPLGEVRLISETTGYSEEELRRFLVGNSYYGKAEGTAPVALDEAERRTRAKQCEVLTSHAMVAFTPASGRVYRDVLTGRNPFYNRPAYRSAVVQLMTEALHEQTGMWRFALSALALINARDYTTSDAPFKSGKNRWIGGKVVPYLEHRLVSLKLPRKIVVRRVTKSLGESLPRRRHEVTGHFKSSHKRGDPNCQHVYVNETETRELCVLCDHIRWWVNEFERGDASLGYVTKDRLVQKG